MPCLSFHPLANDQFRKDDLVVDQHLRLRLYSGAFVRALHQEGWLLRLLSERSIPFWGMAGLQECAPPADVLRTLAARMLQRV